MVPGQERCPLLGQSISTGQASVKQHPASERVLIRYRCYGAGDEGVEPSLLSNEPMERPMKRDDLSRSLVAFDQNSTLVSVVELGLKSWLVGGLVPGMNRQPLKKQKPDPDSLLACLARWRGEAIKAGHTITGSWWHSRPVMTGSGSRGGCVLEG